MRKEDNEGGGGDEWGGKKYHDGNIRSLNLQEMAYLKLNTCYSQHSSPMDLYLE